VYKRCGSVDTNGETVVVTPPVDDAAPLVWPRALLQPPRPPRLVYLDLNHWIPLAQAATGHAQGAGYREALDACRTAKATGAALFPLSATHYIEMYNIKDPRQRRDIAAVMEELSGFATLVSRSVVMVAEVRAVLDAVVGREASTDTVDLLGFGWGPAFGKRGGLRMRDADGRDVTHQLSAALTAALAKADLQLERAFLAGPPDEELPALLEQGYDALAAIKVAQQRAQREEELRVKLDADPRWRRGRLRDVVAARELRHELFDIVEAALRRRGLAWGDVLGDRESLRRFMGAMPSTDVAIALKIKRHRDATLGWIANDINDIDALSLAVPYCDLVVTEKFAHHLLTTSRVAERMNTVVMRSMSELHRHFA
jgi:hypothetical protein